MKYNIAKNALISINTTIGNVSMTTSGISAMLDYSEYPVVTLSSTTSGILVIDCDLGCRIDTYSINYNFRCSASIEDTASGIEFYYRDESFGDYTSLPTYYEGTEHFYYTPVSGTLFTPRYIRTITTMTSISGTTVTGTVHGFEILNNDSIVDFGIDGHKTEENFYLTREGEGEIKTVSIYNSGTNISDAIINIEPSYNNLDQVISISDNINGPWTYVFDENSVIANSENFNEGKFSGTEVVGDTLQVTGLVDKDAKYVYNIAVGTYITRVFDREGFEELMFTLNKNTSALAGKIAVDSEDITDTIEVRYSNTKPVTYAIYRTLYTYYPGSGTTSYVAFKDYLRSTGLLVKVSTYYFFSFPSVRSVMDYYVTIDPVTQRWAGFVYTGGSSGGTYSEWRLFNNIKESTSVTKLLSTCNVTNGAMLFKWSEVILDSTGGVWVYFWATSYRSTDFVNNTGYYISYLDSNLIERFKQYSNAGFVTDMSVDYNEGFAWYTDAKTNTVFKTSRDGVVVISYGEGEYTDSLGGIAALSDGSAWYFNDGSLYRIRQAIGSGASFVVFIDSIDGVSTGKFSKLALDGDGSEALWFIEEFSVGRIFLTGDKRGQVDFKVILDTPTRLMPTTEGCYVWCASTETTGSTHVMFVSKTNKRAENNFPVTYASTPGTAEYFYNSPYYANVMPISADTVWSNLPWNKISAYSYMLPNDNYQQLKITLRTESTSNVPLISSDNFTQADGPPANTQLWGDWTKTYNIVTVQNNRLVLPGSGVGTAGNAYINTRNRMLISPDSSGQFSIQAKFLINDGVATSIEENIYLHIFAMDAANYGDYMCARFQLNSAQSLWYVYQNTSYTYGYVAAPRYYNVTMRLRKDSANNIIADFDIYSDGSFDYSMSLGSASSYGQFFYVQIMSSKAGSVVYVDDFQVTSGNAYYYDVGTPGIKSIYTLKPVIIDDIYPNTSKNLYVRSQVPQGLDVLSQYETNLNVKWRIPTN